MVRWLLTLLHTSIWTFDLDRERLPRNPETRALSPIPKRAPELHAATRRNLPVNVKRLELRVDGGPRMRSQNLAFGQTSAVYVEFPTLTQDLNHRCDVCRW